MKICLQCRYFYHGHGKKPSLCTNRHSGKFPDKLRHDGHSSVCKHFRPPKHKHEVGATKYPSSFLSEYKGRLRFIESLRNQYAGKEIWVLATGPSLDDIPSDFLREPEPKISITVKEAGIAFPDATYNFWTLRDYALRHVYLPRGMISGSFGRFIFSIRKNDMENFFGKQALKATYMRFTQGGTMEQLKGVCESIAAGTSSTYCGVYTITHLAIEAALVMGASRVSLIGCDHGFSKTKFRAQDRGMSQGYGWTEGEELGYRMMRPGTNFLGDFFRSRGVEIARYYHGRGYERVGDAVEDEDTIKEAEGIWKDTKKEDVRGTREERDKEAGESEEG